jgi:hypothetical protein
LAAIAYARNQGPFDVSKLESAYSQVDPNALAFPYDIQTGQGRQDLTSSLTQRGVMGSSFGDQGLSSYDTMRGLGRQNLLTSGSQAQAGIANQILQAQIAEREQKNRLYGSALLALSGGLSPRVNITNQLPGGGGGGGGGGSLLRDLGGLAGGAAALYSAFSDRRLKSNIVKIGEDARGFNIYEYDLFGERETGVMADEVEKVIPEAVSIGPMGYKMVNYAML